MSVEIKKFWLWWEKNDLLIQKVLNQGSDAKLKELKEHIDKKILDFGHFTWEINEGESKAFLFIISPNRDYELLQYSKRIIKAAPKLDHWEFGFAKPANPNPEPFKLYDGNLDPLFIHPQNWEMEIEGKVAMVKAEELKTVDEETRMHAMDLVVTAYFGEQFRIENIEEIRLLKE